MVEVDEAVATAGRERGRRTDTREAILDAAERLFADTSFAAVSLRDITSAAGVNLAAVNYHFGSKDALITDLFRTRVTALNRERAQLLRLAEERAGGAPALEEILYALVAPPIRWWFDPSETATRSARVLNRAFVEGTAEIRDMMERDVGHLQRFLPPLARALPHLSHPELCWRLHFTIGVEHYAIGDLRRLSNLSNGACVVDDPEPLIRRAIAFAAAGLRAP